MGVRTRKRVIIDLNVRIPFPGSKGVTYAGFEDVIGEVRPCLHEDVDVVEIETGVAGRGRVVGVDLAKSLIYLDVDWAGLRWPTPTTS